MSTNVYLNLGSTYTSKFLQTFPCDTWLPRKNCYQYQAQSNELYAYKWEANHQRVHVDSSGSHIHATSSPVWKTLYSEQDHCCVIVWLCSCVKNTLLWALSKIIPVLRTRQPKSKWSKQILCWGGNHLSTKEHAKFAKITASIKSKIFNFKYCCLYIALVLFGLNSVHCWLSSEIWVRGRKNDRIILSKE